MITPRAAIFAVAALALAQDPASNKPAANASISGVVKDRKTGQPLAEYSVSTSLNATWVGDTINTTSSTKQVSATTDKQGRYRLSDLPPGEYRVQARSVMQFGNTATKQVLVSGSDLENINFNIPVEGTIAGKVVDENKEPVPGMTVYLVGREYYLGKLGYFLRAGAQTNDRGEYTLGRVQAAQEYFVLAQKREGRVEAHSNVPLNPKLRKRIPMRTWYPNSPSSDGASPVMIQSGERRDGVNIEVRKSQSYCVEGILSGLNGPGEMNFVIEAQNPSSGTSNNGGMFVLSNFGKTGPDGNFRLCELYPGMYRLTAYQDAPDRQHQPPAYGVSLVTISDRDIANLKALAIPGTPLEGEVVLDGETPEKPLDVRASISLQPLLRANYGGEQNFQRTDIPGTFSFPGPMVDDYTVRAGANGPGLYVRDVTYGGRSVQYDVLHLGAAMGGAAMRVVIARNGGKISASVKDKDSKPVPDIRVIFMPADIASEGELAARLMSSLTNQAGRTSSITLAPGKYYVAATEDSPDRSPQSIDRLWRSRARFTEVEVPPNGAPSVTLEPVKLQ